MQFSIVIYAAPYSAQAAESAYRFTSTLLDEGHSVYRLFFFSDGVHNLGKLAVSGQDEINLPQRWQDLIERHELDSVACVSSAIKRGIINSQEAQRYELDAVSIQDNSEIAGLGQLIDAVIQSDRVVSFG
ncbi:MAG: sulfurtransferase complex subunit TusD [Pseudomonadales bacterium]|nr:sulfurtransferase complex subunit TusD [Pseudomonadales bacterium]